MFLNKKINKNVSTLLLSLILFSSSIVSSNAIRVNTYENANIDIDSVMVIDENSGDVLYSQKPDKVRNIASVTKCMTLLLTLEAVDRGDLSLDKVVEIKDVPDSWGSVFGFKKGEKYTVYELLEMAMIISANDACIILANTVSGSEEQFVKDMNLKAKQLGMTNTKFFNPNGLPLGHSNNSDGGNVSTAKDIAYLVKFILNNYSDIVNKITSTKTLNLKNMEYPRNNTNKLLFRNDKSNGFNVDGFKTGYTPQAGYCLVTTSTHDNNTPEDKSDDFRVIGVSLGGKSYEPRFKEHSRMLKYISDKYTNTTLIKRDEIVKTVNNYKDKKYDINLVPQEDLTALIYNSDISQYEKEISVGDIKYPVKKGEILGKIIYINKNNPEIKFSTNLVSASAVEDISLFDRIFKTQR